MADLIVLGAGAAGLSAAHFARKAGLKVEIFEASAHPGGRMQTTREKGFTVEHGPLGWLDGEEALEEICADLHLNIIRSKVADTHRYIQHAGKLFPLPQGPAAFATSKLLNWKEKLRFLSEPMADLPADGTKETVRDFANRRFGNGFEKKIVRPSTHYRSWQFSAVRLWMKNCQHCLLWKTSPFIGAIWNKGR